MNPVIGQIVLYAGAPSGKIRPAIVVAPYEGTDLAHLVVFEPHATPFGVMYVEAREISPAEAARGIQGFYMESVTPPVSASPSPLASVFTQPEIQDDAEVQAKDLTDLNRAD